MPERFVFRDLRDLLAKANEEKSGDQLAGIAARSERERVAAKRKLADLSLDEIVRQPLVDPSRDEVSRLLLESYDADRFQRFQGLTVGEFREFILDDATSEERLKELQWAIVPEIAAAVAKIMSNKDLILAAAKIRNVTRCRNTMGERGVLGIRTQPNHPVDDIGGILLAAFEGLLFGCGDAVIGVNPASDSVETVGAILRSPIVFRQCVTFLILAAARMRSLLLMILATAAAISGTIAHWSCLNCSSLVASSRINSRNSPTVMLWIC